MAHSCFLSRTFLPIILLVATPNCFTRSQPAQPGCPRNALRSIGNSDVVQYIYPAGYPYCFVGDLLTSKTCTTWCLPATTTLPRSVTITFVQPLVLEGLVTEGLPNGFVNDFSIQYAPSTSSSLQPFLEVSLPTENSHTVVFPHPIIVQHIQLIMNSAIVLSTSSFFYWHLNILGCLLSSINDTAGSDPSINYNVTMLPSSVSFSPIDEMVSPTFATPGFYTEPKTCSAKTFSVTIKQTVVTTETVTVISMASPSLITDNLTQEKYSGSDILTSRLSVLVFSVLGAILLLVITVLVVTCVVVVCWRRQKTKKRSSTLVEVSNVNLYELHNSSDFPMESRTTGRSINGLNSITSPPAVTSVSKLGFRNKIYNSLYSDTLEDPLIDGEEEKSKDQLSTTASTCDDDEMYASIRKYQKPQPSAPDASSAGYETIN